VRDSLVYTSTLSSRNSSIVDNVHAAPTAIARSSDTALAIRVDLARIIDDLAFAFKRDLIGDKFENLVSIPLANLWVSTLHPNKDLRALGGGHGIIERGRSRSTNATNSVGNNLDLRCLVNSIDSFVDASRGGDPQLVGYGRDLSGNPDRSRRVVDGSHSASEGSIPFTFHVSSADLKPTVVTDKVNRGVVVLYTALLASLLRCSSHGGRIALQSGGVTVEAGRSTLLGTFCHRHTMFCVFALMGHHIADIGIADTLCLAGVGVSTMSWGGLVALVRGLVALVGRRETRSRAFSQRLSFTGCSARNTLEVSLVTNVTIASLILVVLRTDPFLKSRRRMVRVVGLSGAVGS